MDNNHENVLELEERLAELRAIERRLIEEQLYDLRMEIAELEDRIDAAYNAEAHD